MPAPDPSPRSGIGIRSLTLMAIAAVCLVLGALAVYARATILDEDAFTARAVSTLSSDEVDEELADRLTNRLLVQSPSLVRWRPVVLDEAQRLTATPGFTTSFDSAARRLQHALFADRYQLASFDIGPAGTTLKRAVAEREPKLAAPLRSAQASDLMDLSGGGIEGKLRKLAPTARRLDVLGVPLLLMALVLLGGAVGLAPDRRRGLHAAALVVGGTGVALVAGWMAARAITLQLFDTSHGDAVVGQIWDAFLGDLRLWSLALAGAGIALAACIAATLPHGEPTRLIAAARAKLGREALRAPQALGLLLLAAVVLVAPEVFVDLFAVAVAGGLLYCGVHQLARLAVR
jgi:hypothetical protein